MAIEDGYGSVNPLTPGVARALLEIAEELGLSPDAIRVSLGGFIAPDDVVKKYEETLGAEPESASDEAQVSPDDSWSNAQIKAWAEAHDVDLGDATKKADMLAAISTADKEE